MAWFLWLPLSGFGLASLACFAASHAHLKPSATRHGSRDALRGSLVRQNIFVPRGWQLRRWAWIFAALALIVLAIAGVTGSPAR